MEYLLEEESTATISGYGDLSMYEWMLITIGREHMYMYEDGSCVPLDSCFPC